MIGIDPPPSGDPMIAAAGWLASLPEPPAHVIPTLKERFGLTGLQACQAIALARNTSSPIEGTRR